MTAITPTCDEDDEARDRVFGPGQWVRCESCQGVHHRAYHGRDAAIRRENHRGDIR